MKTILDIVISQMHSDNDSRYETWREMLKLLSVEGGAKLTYQTNDDIDVDISVSNARRYLDYNLANFNALGYVADRHDFHFYSVEIRRTRDSAKISDLSWKLWDNSKLFGLANNVASMTVGLMLYITDPDELYDLARTYINAAKIVSDIESLCSYFEFVPEDTETITLKVTSAQKYALLNDELSELSHYVGCEIAEK